jgi:hypothetical protein
MIEKMKADIANEVDENHKSSRKTLLHRFRMQIEKPYHSDNIYLELDIENLTQCYIRAKKDISDIHSFFGVTESNKNDIFSNEPRFKSEERIQFEERCYLTKLN